jgi:proteasome assembly chaperone 4
MIAPLVEKFDNICHCATCCVAYRIYSCHLSNQQKKTKQRIPQSHSHCRPLFYLIYFPVKEGKSTQLNHLVHLITNLRFQAMDNQFKSHFFSTDICDTQFNFRILQMKESVFIYIGQNESEHFNEMAMAMQTPTSVIGTSIMGGSTGSQELAEKISKRLKKQVFISCNAPDDRIVRPSIENRLIEEIKEHMDEF